MKIAYGILRVYLAIVGIAAFVDKVVFDGEPSSLLFITLICGVAILVINNAEAISEIKRKLEG